ncbi:MAG: hypothetical protein AB1726_11090 [Planctomycetota bacterium]
MADPLLRRRVPLVCGDFAGFRYVELGPDLETRLPAWLAAGRVEDGEELAGSHVFRSGPHVVKFFPGPRRRRDLFRPPRAVRSADLALRLDGIRTPAPYVALGPRRRADRRAGMLVMEHIPGQPLTALWRRDEAAMDALPRFLAAIARRGVLLGDFHLENALWNGAEWVLLDLDGIRHRGHFVHRCKLIERQWARVWNALGRHPHVFALFVAFLAEAGLDWDAKAAWTRIMRRADRWGR